MRIPVIVAFAVLLAALGTPGGSHAADKAPEPAGPASAAPAPKTPSPEQAELDKLSTENQLAAMKLRKKLAKLSEEKDELHAQYELISEKQRLQSAETELKLNALVLENKLAGERHKLELDALSTEFDRVSTDNRLAGEKLKVEVAKFETETQKLAAQNRLNDERYKNELSRLNTDLLKAVAENKLAAEQQQKAMQALSRQAAELKLLNDLRNEELRQLQIESEKEKRNMDLEVKRMELQQKKMAFEKDQLDNRMAQIKSDLDLRARKEDWKKEANQDPVYLAQPFYKEKGRLVISDRRISLNGPIFGGVADYVTERIHYFNNISSTQPIFIVIDKCPGGSVMEGYRIIKAMQASKAKVHVVVKSFAASMAAVITTMADYSYTYPNAIILHHQMSTVNWGNMTQLKEQLELAREWERRLHVPVAKKMGVSMDAFRKMMYEKNSDGDWEEFGDQAVAYKWADSVVHEIEETGFVKNPDLAEKPKAAQFQWLAEKTDEKGQRYATLPRLDPFDFYFIYNPDRYYR